MVESCCESDIMNVTVQSGLNIPTMVNRSEAFGEYDDAVDDMEGRLNEILDGGHHMHDHTRTQRRKYRHDRDLPCHRILEDCANNDYRRPPLSARRLYG